MKTVVILLCMSVALFGTILVASFLISPDWEVNREVRINDAPETIFPHVNDLKKWPQWTSWGKSGTLSYEYPGPSVGKGAIQIWKDEKLGGKLELTKSEPNRMVAYQLAMDSNYSMDGEILLSADGLGTRVFWRVSGTTGTNPVARYFSLFFDKMVGKDLELGLANLKVVAEKRK